MKILYIFKTKDQLNIVNKFKNHRKRLKTKGMTQLITLLATKKIRKVNKNLGKRCLVKIVHLSD